MFSPEQLFVYNIDKLNILISNPSPENLFESSETLRHLLLDSFPLIHQANKSIGFKIIFEYCPADDISSIFSVSGGISGSFDGFSPQMGQAVKKTTKTGIREFLSAPTQFIEGKPITVKNSIEYVANIAGRVHKRKPDSDVFKALEELSGTFYVMGMPFGLYSLRGVGSVVFDACQPLYHRLRA